MPNDLKPCPFCDSSSEQALEDWNTRAQPAAAATPCKGMNCGCTDGYSHSPECEAQHAATVAGGTFVPASLGSAIAATPGDEWATSPTAGMSLGRRIAHVGGRNNAQGYIEFGSPMAVAALIQHVLRDMSTADEDGSFQARYRLKPDGVWSDWGAVTCGVKGHDQELRYLPTGKTSRAATTSPAAAPVLSDEREAFEAWAYESPIPDAPLQLAPFQAGAAWARAVLAAHVAPGGIADPLRHPIFRDAELTDWMLRHNLDDRDFNAMREAMEDAARMRPAAPAAPQEQPSDEEIMRLWDETPYAKPFGDDRNVVWFVRALLSRCGAVPQAGEDVGDQIEHLDVENHRLRRAMQKIMTRLTNLLDEDQFSNIESIVKDAGVKPPAPDRGDAQAIEGAQWTGLTPAERDGFVGDLVDYGTKFFAPLYAVIESVEKRLREKNAAALTTQGDSCAGDQG